MNKIYIIGIILIALAIGAIVSTLSNSSTYATFTEAAKNPNDLFHVVGKLHREKAPIYDPQKILIYLCFI